YPYGILVDILNDGAYTPEQLDKVYTIIADEKPADLAADVGYFDSVTGVQTILKRVYSTDLSQNSWNAIPDPGINN
ncbi:MAG: hypothetical protein H3C45_12575, partial [Bacteroidia bacterium]|nr:hypothetical protein [Bacteroidia bacterium]